MKNTADRVIGVIANALQLDEAEIVILKDTSGYKKLRKWTSARHAEIMVALEDEFGLTIDETSIPRLVDVSRIVDYIDANAR